MKPLETEYVMKLFVIDKSTIGSFRIYEDERRKIRKGKVDSIRIGFDREDRNERHFDSPLVVNKVESQWNMVDGNHRLCAVEDKLVTDPEFSIRVWIAEYKGLNREEERMVYRKWNRGTPESATDFLQIHFKTIPLGEHIIEQLPVAVYGTDDRMQVKLIMGAHLMAKRGNRMEGGYTYGGERTVADFMELTHEDIRTVKAFFKDMKEIFGEFHRGHQFYRTTPVHSFYRIWYDNRQNPDIPRDRMIGIWQKTFAAKIGVWDPFMRSSGRTACQLFYEMAIKQLNANSKLHWVTADQVAHAKEFIEKEETTQEQTEAKA